MSILVLRHERFEHLGLLAQPLEAQRLSFTYHDLNDPLPAQDFSRIIILGGPMSANDPIPGLADELRVIEAALKRGTPMLGICLGSQLIAKALGARVFRNSALEIGWKAVHLTGTGRTDPLFAGFDSPTTFFHWHGDTFDLPNGAEWLAWSEKTRHQAYRYGSNVYGLQFHPEVDAAMISDWSRQPCNCGDVSRLNAPIDPAAHDQSAYAKRFIENWLDRCIRGGPQAPEF